MPGIRLHHPTLKNCVLICPSDELSAGPHFCELCREIHTIRTRHIRLDGNGDAIVSPVIFRRMKRAGLHNYGLEIANEVKRPPAQTLSLDRPGTPFPMVRSKGPSGPLLKPTPRRDEEGERKVRLEVPEARTIRRKGDMKDG